MSETAAEAYWSSFEHNLRSASEDLRFHLELVADLMTGELLFSADDVKRRIDGMASLVESLEGVATIDPEALVAIHESVLELADDLLLLRVAADDKVDQWAMDVQQRHETDSADAIVAALPEHEATITSSVTVIANAERLFAVLLWLLDPDRQPRPGQGTPSVWLPVEPVLSRFDDVRHALSELRHTRWAEEMQAASANAESAEMVERQPG